jgi:hypothetical protein
MHARERIAIAAVAIAVAAIASVAAVTTARAAGADEGDSDPHASASAHAGGAAAPGVFQPPEDSEQADPALPPGTIAVDLRDADDRPVAHQTVTLGILINSIAKGDSRKHLQAQTDEAGRVVFGGLETASNIAYRVGAPFQGGAFAASPFQLEQAKAMHVVLHVYAVAHDFTTALVVAEATVAAEVREDRLQLEEVLTFYNLGRTAWQPENIALPLPGGYTAFSTQASMTDQGVDEVGGSARLRGTFPPGRHTVEFRWQLPMSGEKDMAFVAALPPHVAAARVVMPASADITLTATGFPAGDVRRDAQGQRFLVLERRVRPDEAKLTALDIAIHGLPTPGPGRLVATALAACGVAAGLAFAFSRRLQGRLDAPDATVGSALLRELGELEQARLAGDVGPKTYERMRREIVDMLARTLAKA